VGDPFYHRSRPITLQKCTPHNSGPIGTVAIPQSVLEPYPTILAKRPGDYAAP